MNLHHAIETYRGHTIPHVKWVEKRNIWFAISGVMVLLSIAGIVLGLNYSIEFEGGADHLHVRTAGQRRTSRRRSPSTGSTTPRSRS